MSARPFYLLLVDDEVADAELFSELFREMSPEVEIHHVCNGQEALDYLEAGFAGDASTPRPHLIVLDINMPVMNGHRFLQIAKAHDHFRSIPVLVLSTSVRADDILQSYQNYASGYSVKPSSYADLQKLVELVSRYWQGAVRFPTIEQVAR
ncbi:MAG: response regulator [Deinococcus sp.]